MPFLEEEEENSSNISSQLEFGVKSAWSNDEVGFFSRITGDMPLIELVPSKKLCRESDKTDTVKQEEGAELEYTNTAQITEFMLPANGSELFRKMGDFLELNRSADLTLVQKDAIFVVVTTGEREFHIMICDEHDQVIYKRQIEYQRNYYNDSEQRAFKWVDKNDLNLNVRIFAFNDTNISVGDELEAVLELLKVQSDVKQEEGAKDPKKLFPFTTSKSNNYRKDDEVTPPISQDQVVIETNKGTLMEFPLK